MNDPGDRFLGEPCVIIKTTGDGERNGKLGDGGGGEAFAENVRSDSVTNASHFISGEASIRELSEPRLVTLIGIENDSA